MLSCWNQAQLFWRAKERRDHENLLAATEVASSNTAKGADLLNPRSCWEAVEDVIHLCSPDSNEEEEDIAPGEDGWRTRSPALTGAVEGKRTARRRQLPGRECVTSQETGLYLCLRSLLFLPSPNNLCRYVVCCNCHCHSRRKLNLEKTGPLSPRWVTVTIHSLFSRRMDIGSSIFPTSW